MSQIRQDYQQLLSKRPSAARMDIEEILKNFAGNLSNGHVLSMSKCLHLMESQVTRLEEKKAELVKKRELVVQSAIEEIKKVRLEQEGFSSFELSKSVFDDKQLCYKKYMAYLDKLGQVGKLKGELMDVGKALHQQISAIESQLADYHYIFENIKVSLETLIIPEITRRKQFAYLLQSFNSFYSEWMDNETQIRASFFERGDLADLPYSFKKMLIDVVYDEAFLPPNITLETKSSKDLEILAQDLRGFFKSYSSNPDLKLQAKLQEYLETNVRLRECIASKSNETEKTVLTLKTLQVAVEEEQKEKEDLRVKVAELIREVQQATEDSVEWEDKYHSLKANTENMQLQLSSKTTEMPLKASHELESSILRLKEELANKEALLRQTESRLEGKHQENAQKMDEKVQELQRREQSLVKSLEDKCLEVTNLHQISGNLMGEMQMLKAELDKEKEARARFEIEAVKAVEQRKKVEENQSLVAEIERNYQSEIEELGFRVEGLMEELDESQKIGDSETLRRLREDLKEKEELLLKALDDVELHKANANIIEADSLEKLKRKEAEMCKYCESIVELEDKILQLKAEHSNDSKLKNVELELSNHKAYVEELRATIAKNQLEYSSHTAKLKELWEEASKREKEAHEKLHSSELELTKSSASSYSQRRKEREYLLQQVAKALDSKLASFVDKFTEDSRLGMAECRLASLQKILHEHQINLLKNSLK